MLNISSKFYRKYCVEYIEEVLSKIYQKARTTQDWTKYHSIQKRCKREIRRAEWRHINSTIQEGLDSNNTKPFCNFVKARMKDNVGVSPLEVNGRLFSNRENKAEIFLKQFKSVL